MKNILKTTINLLITLCVSNVEVFGYSGVYIDGDFDDWRHKPYINDHKHKEKDKSEGNIKIKYFCDEKYLYINARKGDIRDLSSWDSSIVILNAIEGVKQKQYIYGSAKPKYAPQFDISASYANGKKKNDKTFVNVEYDGEIIEKTLSVSNNDKEMEFRIPLNIVGLDGGSKEVRFIMKYYDDKEPDKVRVLPREGAATITTGPTLWKWSYALFFLLAFIPEYNICKKLRKG